ncbi:MAG: indole-3-glycerol phosphate synthase TrpC [Archaeoglobaceae archaeon]
MFGLGRALRKASHKANAIIAEVKVRSPKDGDLLRNRDPIEVLRAFERGGAAAISYITEPHFFGGSMKLLKQICSSTHLPVLRKDFIVTKREIEATAEAGAAAVLLIARILKDDTAEFVDFAADHGIDAVVEVHGEDELKFVEGVEIVGINNRDIARLEKDDGDVRRTVRIAPLVKADLKISESGIRSVDDLLIALRYADAALVGTAFMRAENPEEVVRTFVNAPNGRRA